MLRFELTFREILLSPLNYAGIYVNCTYLQAQLAAAASCSTSTAAWCTCGSNVMLF